MKTTNNNNDARTIFNQLYRDVMNGSRASHEALCGEHAIRLVQCAMAHQSQRFRSAVQAGSALGRLEDAWLAHNQHEGKDALVQYGDALMGMMSGESKWISQHVLDQMLHNFACPNVKSRAKKMEDLLIQYTAAALDVKRHLNRASATPNMVDNDDAFYRKATYAIHTGRLLGAYMDDTATKHDKYSWYDMIQQLSNQ